MEEHCEEVFSATMANGNPLFGVPIRGEREKKGVEKRGGSFENIELVIKSM